MKSALLLTAMLSGLCAEVMAAPIGDLSYENRSPPPIAGDLHFNAGSPDDALAFLEEYRPEEYPQVLVTTDFNQAMYADDQPAIDIEQASGYLGVPEPPPAVLILSGLTGFGFFALGRRVRWKRRRSRRRTVVYGRPLTAKR
jgi:hypothetical protein